MDASRAVVARWTHRSRVGPGLLFASMMAVMGAVGLGFLGYELGVLALFIGSLVGMLDYLRPSKEHHAEARIGLEPLAVHVVTKRKTWRISGKDVTAATTARGAHGWDLTLQLRGQEPLVLEGLEQSAVGPLCETLGIGWAGVGVLQFRDVRSPIPLALFFLSAFYIFPAAVSALTAGLPMVGMAFGVAWYAALAAWGTLRRLPMFTMANAGLTMAASGARVGMLWQDFENVVTTPHSLTLFLRGRSPYVIPIRSTRQGYSVSPVEAAMIERHVLAALERHRGLGRPRRLDVTAELLDRGSLTTPEWHAHLDRMAAELAGQGGGYRSQQLTLEQLHQVLANADLHPTARIAAARIVSRVEGDASRERIALVASSLRDEEYERALAEALEQAPAPMRTRG